MDQPITPGKVVDNRSAILPKIQKVTLTKDREKKLYKYYLGHKKLFSKKDIGFQSVKRYYRDMDEKQRDIVDKASDEWWEIA